MRVTTYDTRLNQETGQVVLVKEKSMNYSVGTEGLNKPEKIVEMMNGIFQLGERAEEYIYLLCFNKKNNKITGIFEISHGTVDRAILGVREIFIRVLLSGASNLIIAHNHPSQSVNASKEDIQITKRVLEAAKLLGVDFLDHIIIGWQSYYSFREDKSLDIEWFP